MSNHSIVNNGRFFGITWGRCRCYAVIKKQSCALCVFEDDTNVANFISTAKIVETKTRYWRFIRVG